MTTQSKKKSFDCVEFKRSAQARIHRAIAGLSPEQEIDYFRRAADEGPLGSWWKALREQTGFHPSARP